MATVAVNVTETVTVTVKVTVNVTAAATVAAGGVGEMSVGDVGDWCGLFLLLLGPFVALPALPAPRVFADATLLLEQWLPAC